MSAAAEAEYQSDAEPEAVLRLRGGDSAWFCWPFAESDRGRRILIGSDPACDWRICAPGMTAQELEVVFTGRALLVRSLRPGAGMRLNGFALGAGWTPVQDGSGLELGGASIEVGIRAAQADDWEGARRTATRNWIDDQANHPPAQTAEAANDLTSGGPYLFGHKARPISSLPTYLACAVLLGGAYALWVVLLDRI